jgi:putative transposase
MKYETLNHSKVLLMHLIIFVCKYRRKLFFEPIKEEIKQIIFDISKESDFEILEMETDEDHIHFLIEANQKLVFLRSLED